MAYGRKSYSNNQSNKDGKPKRKWIPFNKAPAVVRGSTYKPMLNPSSEQLAVIEDVISNNDALVVNSLAGCAKTSTSVEAMRKIPLGKTIQYTIFNNKNAREAEGKTDARVNVATCHSLGLKNLKRVFSGRIEVSSKGEKDSAIVGGLVGHEDKDEDLRFNLMRAMELAKSHLAETNADVQDVCDRYDIDMCLMNPEEFVNNVLKGMQLSLLQNMTVSFGDMIWLPIKLNIDIEKSDYVFLDEGQDTGKARQELVLRCLKPGGKLVVVGDENQSIFQWTGCNDHPMQDLIKRTSAHTLHLNTTFRCGKKIVELARQYVPEYRAADTNVEGEVAEKTMENMFDQAEPGDFILSRVNKPLVSVCLALVKRGVKATVLGKDLGKSLVWMIRRSEAQSVSGFLDWLDAWAEEERARLVKRNKSFEHINDKHECLTTLCEDEKSLDDVKKRISLMFGDENKLNDGDKDRVVLSSIHRAKGRESDRVWLMREKLDDARDPDNWKVKYVGITRSRHSLFFV